MSYSPTEPQASLWSAAVVLCLALIPALAQDARVTANVSADVVGVQEQFQLTITVSGNSSSEAEPPRIGQPRGARIVSGPSVSTQYQWVNGRSSSSRSFAYILLPEQVGEIAIEPIEVRIGSTTLRTEPIRVRVTAEPQGRPSQMRRPRAFDPFADEEARSRQGVTSEEVFINAEVDKATAVAGQQVTLSYHLYTQVSVTGIQLQDSPPLSGFWVEDLEVPSNQSGTRRLIDGREYLEYVVKKQALFPNATGRLRIPPATFAVSARSAGGVFGLFGPSETLYRKTREVIIDVQPLPMQGRPADFKNAVGTFSLTSSLDKSEVMAGSAVTLLVKLSGRGNLKVQPDIELPPLADLTVYSSKQTQNLRPADGDRIGGDRVWEYVLVPRVPGRFTIPALSFSYFDPERGRYETAATASLGLSVVRGAETSGATGVLSGIQRENLTRQGSDINFIKLSQAGIEGPAPPPYQNGVFWLLVVLPLIANAGALVYRRHQMQEAGNVVLARRRKARGVALTRLKKAAALAPKGFYDEAAAAFSDYLADRFNLPDIALTADVLERELSAQQVSDPVVAEVAACMGECDFGRFVSASSDPARRKALDKRIRLVIDSLEKADA
jgi:hypothetical protein